MFSFFSASFMMYVFLLIYFIIGLILALYSCVECSIYHLHIETLKPKKSIKGYLNHYGFILLTFIIALSLIVFWLPLIVLLFSVMLLRTRLIPRLCVSFSRVFK